MLNRKNGIQKQFFGIRDLLAVDVVEKGVSGYPLKQSREVIRMVIKLHRDSRYCLRLMDMQPDPLRNFKNLPLRRGAMKI